MPIVKIKKDGQWIEVTNALSDADTLDGKHADAFALAAELDELQNLVGENSVADQVLSLEQKVNQVLNNYYTKNDIENKNFASKTYVDEKIASIPTPDVSGQINGHNTSNSAHSDIREAIAANTSAIELLTNGANAEEVDSVNDLIQYVKNHGSEVIGIKADIKANTNAIAAIKDSKYLDSFADIEDKYYDKTWMQNNYYTGSEINEMFLSITEYVDGQFDKAKTVIVTCTAPNNDVGTASMSSTEIAAAVQNGNNVGLILGDFGLSLSRITNNKAIFNLIIRLSEEGIEDEYIYIEVEVDENKKYILKTHGLASYNDLISIADGLTQSILDINNAINISSIPKDKTILEMISDAQNAAESHANSLNNAMNARVEALEAIDHEHANANVLNGITVEKVAAWDNVLPVIEIEGDIQTFMGETKSLPDSVSSAFDVAYSKESPVVLKATYNGIPMSMVLDLGQWYNGQIPVVTGTSFDDLEQYIVNIAINNFDDGFGWRITIQAEKIDEPTGTNGIADGAITKVKLSADVQASLDKAHSHKNAEVLNGISTEKVAAWDSAEQNAKNYVDEQVENAKQILITINQSTGKASMTSSEIISAIMNGSTVILALEIESRVAFLSIYGWDNSGIWFSLEGWTSEGFGNLVACIDDGGNIYTEQAVISTLNNLTTAINSHNTDSAAHSDIRSLIDGLESNKISTSALSSAIDTALAQAKASGEFDGADGIRGTSIFTSDYLPSMNPDGELEYETSKINISELFNTTQMGDIIISTVNYNIYEVRSVNSVISIIVELIGNIKGNDGVSISHSWNGTSLTITSANGSSSADLKGDIGQRGTGLLPVTTAPSSYTTAIGGITPKYRMELNTIKTQSGATEVLLGDTIRYSYYHYPIAYMDASYAYCTTRTSIRGATGAAPVKGTDYFTDTEKADMVAQVKAAMPTLTVTGIDENGVSHTWLMYGVSQE